MKNNNTHNTLITWEIATTAMTKEFLRQVFPENENDYYWTCDEIGHVLCVADCFVDLDRIVEYFRYGATPEQFFEYYDAELDNATFCDNPKRLISFKNFVKYGWDLGTCK